MSLGRREPLGFCYLQLKLSFYQDPVEHVRLPQDSAHTHTEVPKVVIKWPKMILYSLVMTSYPKG